MEYTATPIIFFLTLEDSLPSPFYALDRSLRDMGFILVPVKIDQLQTLASITDQNNIVVLCSVVDFREYKLFNEKVRGLLKYVLKSKRINFMQLSSFSRLNDSRIYSFQKNYYFLKYPLNARTLCHQIARFYDLKSDESSRWPGGKRAGLISA